MVVGVDVVTHRVEDLAAVSGLPQLQPPVIDGRGIRGVDRQHVGVTAVAARGGGVGLRPGLPVIGRFEQRRTARAAEDRTIADRVGTVPENHVERSSSSGAESEDGDLDVIKSRYGGIRETGRCHAA